MKSVVKGKLMKEFYSVKENTKVIKVDGEDKRVFTAKPCLKQETELTGWEDILTIDGEIRYNQEALLLGWRDLHRFNLSEDETVELEKAIYRADLGETHVFTNKVVKTDEVNKEECEGHLSKLLADFNEQMITSNASMLAYCKLHKLDLRETDCEEVFKLVYPGEKYEILNGKMCPTECTPGRFAGKTISEIIEKMNSNYVTSSQITCNSITTDKISSSTSTGGSWLCK